MAVFQGDCLLQCLCVSAIISKFWKENNHSIHKPLLSSWVLGTVPGAEVKVVVMVVHYVYLFFFFTILPSNDGMWLSFPWVWARLHESHLTNRMWPKWQYDFWDEVIKGNVASSLLCVTSLSLGKASCRVLRMLKKPYGKVHVARTEASRQ